MRPWSALLGSNSEKLARSDCALTTTIDEIEAEGVRGVGYVDDKPQAGADVTDEPNTPAPDNDDDLIEEDPPRERAPTDDE